MRVRPAQARLPAARRLRLQIRIADEGAGEKAVQIVEGRLGGTLAIGAEQGEAATRADEDGGTEGGLVRKGAEIVMADGKIGDDRRAPLGPPFPDKGGQLARPVLVGAAKEAAIAGAEILVLMFD